VEPGKVIEGGLSDTSPALELVRKSGGVTRLLVRMLDSAMRHSVVERPEVQLLTAEDIAETIKDEEKAAARALSLHQEFAPDLLHSWRTTDAPLRGAARLLHANLLLCYENDFTWFRPSPLLERYLRIKYPNEAPPLPEV
jgi:hypothetical protein